MQLAKRIGATVVATAGGRSTAAVRAQRAGQIIDYIAASLADALDDKVDVVINLAAIPPAAAADLVPLVREGGVIVSIATPIEPPDSARITAVHFVARNDSAQLAEIVKLIDSVEITESHRLADLTLVHDRSQAGQTHGKITVIP
ncbi:zinc-binding dehydrogenase [Actinomadura sp. 1N219]|uniref:zinc-binding dehydrogenase n=1 Tax=Actinomadura sp. 1N219 TaxID=3375152 RepID=UPI0037AD6593